MCLFAQKMELLKLSLALLELSLDLGRVDLQFWMYSQELYIFIHAIIFYILSSGETLKSIEFN